MSDKQTWKQRSRKTVFDTPFLKVHQDEVELPNGKIIPDYTLVEKPSVSVIVAINDDNQVLLLNEFKYAAGRFLWGLPAGHIKKNEDPVAGAKRELEEETGIIASEYISKGAVKEYPTKDLHSVFVVVATGLQASGNKEHEATETIGKSRFFSKDEILNYIDTEKISSASTISALVLAGVLR